MEPAGDLLDSIGLVGRNALVPHGLPRTLDSGGGRPFPAVEKEVAKLYSDVPETIRLKASELSGEERRLGNFVEFIGDGRGSQALAKVLAETERRIEALQAEVEGLRRSRDKVFQAPPVEWIQERLGRLQEVLEKNTGESALVLRKVLGRIRLDPARGDIGKAYYWARTSIDTLALIEPPPGRPEGGSTTLRWWRRRESNPRPEAGPARASTCVACRLFLAPRAPAGRIGSGPARIVSRPSAHGQSFGTSLLVAFLDAPQAELPEGATYLSSQEQIGVCK